MAKRINQLGAFPSPTAIERLGEHLGKGVLGGTTFPIDQDDKTFCITFDDVLKTTCNKVGQSGFHVTSGFTVDLETSTSAIKLSGLSGAHTYIDSFYDSHNIHGDGANAQWTRFSSKTDDGTATYHLAFQAGKKDLWRSKVVGSPVLEKLDFGTTDITGLENRVTTLENKQHVGVAGVHVAEKPPITTTNGALWWDTNTASMYVFDSDAWVVTNPGGAGGTGGGTGSGGGTTGDGCAFKVGSIGARYDRVSNATANSASDGSVITWLAPGLTNITVRKMFTRYGEASSTLLGDYDPMTGKWEGQDVYDEVNRLMEKYQWEDYIIQDPYKPRGEDGITPAEDSPKDDHSGYVEYHGSANNTHRQPPNLNNKEFHMVIGADDYRYLGTTGDMNYYDPSWPNGDKLVRVDGPDSQGNWFYTSNVYMSASRNSKVNQLVHEFTCDQGRFISIPTGGSSHGFGSGVFVCAEVYGSCSGSGGGSGSGEGLAIVGQTSWTVNNNDPWIDLNTMDIASELGLPSYKWQSGDIIMFHGWYANYGSISNNPWQVLSEENTGPSGFAEVRHDGTGRVHAKSHGEGSNQPYCKVRVYRKISGGGTGGGTGDPEVAGMVLVGEWKGTTAGGGNTVIDLHKMDRTTAQYSEYHPVYADFGWNVDAVDEFDELNTKSWGIPNYVWQKGDILYVRSGLRAENSSALESHMWRPHLWGTESSSGSNRTNGALTEAGKFWLHGYTSTGGHEYEWEARVYRKISSIGSGGGTGTGWALGSVGAYGLIKADNVGTAVPNSQLNLVSGITNPVYAGADQSINDIAQSGVLPDSFTCDQGTFTRQLQYDTPYYDNLLMRRNFYAYICTAVN